MNKKIPSLLGTGNFFTNQREKNSRTVERSTVVEQKRCKKYRKQWESNGKLQRSYWLSNKLVNKVKMLALKDGVKDSAMVEKLLKKALQ